ncbi:MAG TPA: hypothetical protein VIF44_02525 [Candidatus Limnocylindrales bacterium]|jgi:hypothetical protein
MSDASAPESMSDAGSPAPPDPPVASADHHGLLTFLGVLAMILLLAGAVAASSLTGGGGSDADRDGTSSGQGNAFGQQKKAEKQQQREERQAEKREQQRLRKERQRALQEQRRQSEATGPEVADAISEQTGTVAVQVETDGTTTYVLQTAGGTLVLDIGPPRYWGDANPLVPLVGTSVTMTGVQKPGSDRFAVFTLGDRVIRGPGRPPWAGGAKANGQTGPTNLPTPSIGPTPSSSPAP